MSTRHGGLASRSFIIGSRLWPPAITRASERWSEAIAPSTLVARSYSNAGGVCTVAPLFGGRCTVCLLLVLHGCVGPDHRRARHRLGPFRPSAGIERARR